MASLKGNRTLDILLKAEQEGYGILAQTWCAPVSSCAIGAINLTHLLRSYDAHSAVGLVRAAERTKSPAILQLFPITLAYGKGPFLQYCLDLYVIRMR